MSDSFLDTDDVLQALLEELEHFQAASEKLTLTERDVAALIAATRELTAQFGKVVGITEQQADTITELQAYTEEKVGRVVHQQQESAKPLEAGIKAISGTLVHQESLIRSVANNVTDSRQVIDVLSGSMGIQEQQLNLTAAGVTANEQKLTVIADALLAAHTMLNTQAGRIDSLDNRLINLGVTAGELQNAQSALVSRVQEISVELAALHKLSTNELRPLLGEVQTLARANRRLLVLVLILTLVSAGLGGYLVWLTIQ